MQHDRRRGLRPVPSKRRFPSLLHLVLLAGLACALTAFAVSRLSTPQPVVVTDAPAPAEVIAVAGPTTPIAKTSTVEIAAGDSLGTILSQVGLSTTAVHAAALEITDLANIRAGRTFTFRQWNDEAPHRITYALGEDETLVLDNYTGEWRARLDAVEYEAIPARRSFEVRTSLWEAATDAGLRPADIVEVAKVFQYEIDFNTEVRQGMTVEVVADELWHDGEPVKLGQPHLVRLRNPKSSGSEIKEYVAIHYTHADGETHGYYSPEGMARKKAFLRSPLEFSRVTSGFDRKRYHPVLKRTRPHYGVDFGAPTGTPIRAVADGVVTYAATNGGHGRFVKIDHAGPYKTSYSHLSRINVKKGEHVTQGQIIGKVGSTGLATGPHLHYEFWKGSSRVDPLKVDLPLTEPLPDGEKPAFFAVRDRWMAMLEDDAPVLASAE